MCTRSDFPPYDGPPVPVVQPGPGWFGHGPNFDDHADAAFGSVYLEPCDQGGSAAEIYVRLSHVDHPTMIQLEAGAELTLEDLAALVVRACEVGAIAATARGADFFGEAFDRAREHLERVLA
jgi:hypothetical protein